MKDSVTHEIWEEDIQKFHRQFQLHVKCLKDTFWILNSAELTSSTINIYQVLNLTPLF